MLELDIDGEGHLTRLARSQPPFGADVDDLRRIGTESVFSEFDTAEVSLPLDLP
ncbi:MAG: hypothetical protein ACR2QE_10745 [Acidimicrobiales bacterium]